MHQENLWQSAARCTGLTVIYNYRYLGDGLDGILSVLPHWSKKPRTSGELHVGIDENSQDVLPELAWEAFDGFRTTDPGYFVPRNVQRHLKDYKDTAD